MTPTYPENIRLLGPRSWEEIESQQTTDRLPTGILTPSHSPPHNTHNSILSIFYTKPSAFGLGLDYTKKYRKIQRSIKPALKHTVLVSSIFLVCKYVPAALLLHSGLCPDPDGSEAAWQDGGHSHTLVHLDYLVPRAQFLPPGQ